MKPASDAEQETAAASGDAAPEGEVGADATTKAEDGAAPATEEDAVATAMPEATDDAAGTGTIAAIDDGTAPTQRRGCCDD